MRHAVEWFLKPDFVHKAIHHTSNENFRAKRSPFKVQIAGEQKDKIKDEDMMCRTLATDET